MIRKNRSALFQYAISIFAVCAVAGISFLFTDYIGYKVVAFLLLVTVSVLASVYRIFPVLVAAILSALIWDYFFIPPRFTFTIGTTEDRIFFLMYFVIVLINGALTYKIRQMEKEARKREEKENSIKLYNTLFNSLSHELQTPISTIIGAADTLKDHADQLSEKNKVQLVNEISVASLRLNEQVGNLLNISRLESGHLKLKKDWCDVSELVYSVVNKLRDRSGTHTIEVHIPGHFPLFELDFGIMEQVLYNLLYNAIQYTPADSRISVDLRNTTEINAHFEENKLSGDIQRDSVSNDLVITVSDNGNGFPEDEIEKVFDKFYRLHTSRTGGTGLGLSIVKGFVEAHKGTITLNNILAGGAQFIIHIPAKASYINALKNE